MRLRLNPSLRARLFEMVAIALLPAFGLIVYHSEEQRHQAVVDGAGEAHRYARFVAWDIDRVIDSSGHLLMALAQLREVQNADHEACNQIFAKIIKEYRMYSDLGIADRNGRILCSASMPESRPRIADLIASTGAFARQRLVVGNYHISERSGRAGLNVGFPVRQNESVGLAYVELDLEWLGQIAKSADLPKGSTITLFDRKGTILTHFPNSHGSVGRAVPSIANPAATTGSVNKVINGVSLDGQERLFGIRSVGDVSQDPWAVI